MGGVTNDAMRVRTAFALDVQKALNAKLSLAMCCLYIIVQREMMSVF